MGREDLELLTDREREVVDRIGRGMLPKEVASELGISGPTVSRCIERVGRKLGIADRLGVLRFAVEVSGVGLGQPRVSVAVTAVISAVTAARRSAVLPCAGAS